MTLNYIDPIYGEFEIDGIFEEIIASKAFRRLKGLNQSGIPFEYPLRQEFSRYEHSIGVYLLLKSLGADEKTQIAGLIHDMSHTAFSHVIDWVIGKEQNENYHDQRSISILSKTDLPIVLNKYSYDLTEFSDLEERYPLLKQDLPQLCADRVDYSLRELPAHKASYLFKNIDNHYGTMVFTNQDAAYEFGTRYVWLQMNHWVGFEAVTRYALIADMLKYAIDEEYINIGDFRENDEFIVNKLEEVSKKDKYISKMLNSVKKFSLNHFPKQGKKVRKKFRYLDPNVKTNFGIQQLSEINEDYLKVLEDARKYNEEGVIVPVIE